MREDDIITAIVVVLSGQPTALQAHKPRAAAKCGDSSMGTEVLRAQDYQACLARGALLLTALFTSLTPAHALQERLSALEAELARREAERAEKSKGDPVELKRAANEALHRGDFQRAVDLYTQALQLATTGACSNLCACGALKPVGRTPCVDATETSSHVPLARVV